MKFIDDIQKQPQHIREIMFGLSVFITVLLIGMVWFRSFQKNLYVLLNPEDGIKKSLALENTPVPSLFGSIFQTVGEVKGLLSGLFNANEQADEGESLQAQDMGDKQGQIKAESGKVYKLPLSDYK